MKVKYTLILILFMLNPAWVSAETSDCTVTDAPLTKISDFDGNGIVNGKDIVMLNARLSKKNDLYSALYDRHPDGVLDNTDRFIATRQIGELSSEEDQIIAKEVLAGTYECPNPDTTPDWE